MVVVFEMEFVVVVVLEVYTLRLVALQLPGALAGIQERSLHSRASCS